MAPKESHTLATDRHRHRHRRDRVHREKKRSKKLKLEEEEAGKSLYICYLEHNGDWVGHIIRAIKLSDLLSSSSLDPLRLRQVAFNAGDHLPGSVGSGVFGTQILLAGGLRPFLPRSIGADRHPEAVWHTNVYAFETDPNNNDYTDPNNNDYITIRKLDPTFQTAKQSPMMVELGGKLYALSYRLLSHPPSFEVFDPKVGTWASLPQPPFFNSASMYYERAPFSYAIAGTKMFVSHTKCPVFCFDVAHPDREWRLVPTMCQGGPLPFNHKSLVLDLPEPDVKIVFAYTHQRWFLSVYLISLCENQESITLIGYLKLPQLPDELGHPKRCDFVHIGGQKACIVVPELYLPLDQGPKQELGTHQTFGVAIPFQFQLDITKLGKDKKNGLTLQFMPVRIFEFHTTPSTLPFPETVGTYLL